MSRLILTAVLLTTLILPTNLSAQGGIQRISSIYNFWDKPRDVVIGGDYAYIATGLSGLKVVDISNPEDPEVVNTVYTPNRADNIVIQNEYLYLQRYDGHVMIFDISEPHNPQLIGGYSCRGSSMDLTVYGDYSHSFTYEYEWGELDPIYSVFHRIFDISSPDQPERVYSNIYGNLYPDDPMVSITDMQVQGEYLYVTSMHDGPLQIWDISNIREPYRLGYPLNSIRGPTSINVVGDLLYISSYNGLYTIDVSDIDSLEVISIEDSLRYLTDIKIVNNLAYVIGWAEIDGPYMLGVIDITEPDSPELITTLGIQNVGRTERKRRLDVNGGNAVVTTAYGIQVLNISEPDEPEIVSSFDSSGSVRDVDVSGELACVAAGSKGLRIVDISDIESPVEVGFYNTPGFANQVTINGDLSYIAELYSGLRIIDINDPTDPREVSNYQIEEKLINFQISDDYAYLIEETVGLRIIDISNPDNPAQVGIYRGNGLRDILISGDLAFARSFYSVTIIDISDPSNPTRIGQFEIQNYESVIYGYGIFNQYCYLFARWWHEERPYEEYYGLFIYDISDPENVENIAYNESIIADHMEVIDRFAILTYGGGIYVFDMYDPLNLRLTGSFNSPYGVIYDFSVTGDYAFLSEHFSLGIYDCSDVLSEPTKTIIPPPSFTLLPVYPNPFNSTTTIRYNIDRDEFVTLKLYDLAGREVISLIDGDVKSGRHSIVLNSEGLASGIYFVRLAIPGRSVSRKILLVR